MATLAQRLGQSAGQPRHEWGERARATVWWFVGMASVLPVLEAMRRYPDHLLALALAVPALLLAGIAVLCRPALGACAVITLIYWNLSDVVTDTWGFGWVLKLALAAVGAAWLLEQLLADIGTAWRWPLWRPMLAYGLVLAAAIPGAVDAGAAGSFVEEYAKGVIAFYLVANLLARPRTWRWGILAIVGGAGLLALPVAYQGVSGSRNLFWGFGSMAYAEISPGNWGWRLGGAIGDANFLAMVLVAALPLALVAALERGAPRWRRLSGIAAAGLILTATVFTYSRASVLGMALVAAAVLWKYRRRRGLWLAAVAIGMTAGVLAPRNLLARLATLSPSALTARAQSIGDASLRIRRNAYLAGGLMFLDHPLLGVGPGNYEANYLAYSARIGTGGEDTVRDPHSLPIQIAAETGLAGLVSFTVLLAGFFILAERGRRQAQMRGAPSFADWIWSLELAVATYLLLSVFLHGAYFRHFWLLLALGASGAELALRAQALPVERVRKARA